MRKFKITAIPALLAVALLAGCGSSYSRKSMGGAAASSSASSGGSGVTVKTASIPSAGGTVLVDSSGRTLYSLSAETGGKFICTNSSCESLWHPLVAGGGMPGGAESLGTVKRPDGQEQVTYKGQPLYTFAEDAKPGDDKGQGFKDVGTWRAVTVGGSSSSTPAASASGQSQSGEGEGESEGGGAYGY
jgi:predicted lipoprotein with Yx(FWY)xxD motif